MSNSISVTILTKNSQKHLRACLSALQDFKEVIVLDNGSTDNTIPLAEEFANVQVVRSPFIGFGPLKNLAAQHASNSWILSIDSDEVLTPALKEELLQLNLSDSQKAYTIKRSNYYRNKQIKACGWDNDHVLRLYHKDTTSFANLQVHEYVRTEGLQVQRLQGTLDHFSYDSISQLILKADKYTSLFAAENRFVKKSSPFKSYYKWAFSFFRNFILQRGFLYGYEGFTISFTNAAYSFYKYMKLYEANQTLQISLLILPDHNNTEAVQPSLKMLREAPEEVVVFRSGAAAGREDMIKVCNKYVPVRYTASAESLQQALESITGEYVIIVNGNHVLTPDFIRNYKRKTKRKAYTYTPDQAIAFWREDLPPLHRLNGVAISVEAIATLLQQEGLKRL